jgi:hypothetical protein
MAFHGSTAAIFAIGRNQQAQHQQLDKFPTLHPQHYICATFQHLISIYERIGQQK